MGLDFTYSKRNKYKVCGRCFGWCSYFDWGVTAPRIAERISEDVMNLNCLCVGSSHYHSMKSAAMSRDFCQMLIHNFPVMKSVCHPCFLIGNVKSRVPPVRK